MGPEPQPPAGRAGGLDLSPIITHKLPLEEFEKAFELIGSGQCGKIVFKVAPPEAGGVR